MYQCNGGITATTLNTATSSTCDTNLSTTPTVFKSIIFDSVTKPKLSGLTYSTNNLLMEQ